MACTYSFNDKPKLTYSELIRELKNTKEFKNENGSYFVYSSTVSSQENAVLIINNLSLDSETILPKSRKLVFSENLQDEPALDSDSINRMHLLSFLNSDLFVEESGNRYVFQLNKDELREELKKSLLAKKGDSISEDELNTLVNKESDSWEISAIDGFIIHNLLNQIVKPDDGRHVIEARLDEIAKLHSDNEKLKTRILQLKNNDNFINGILLQRTSEGLISTRPEGSKILYGKTFAKKITVNGKPITVYETVDQIVVDALGNVHLYKIKASSKPTSLWQSDLEDSEKVERYRYELSFLKSILHDQGIPNSKIQIHLITSEINYDHESENFDIESLNPNLNILLMDVHNGKVITSKHQSVADQFVLPKTQIVNVTNNIISANNVISRVWPESGISLQMMNISAEDWIKQNKLFIHRSTSRNHSYLFYFPGEKEIIYINEDSPIEENTELLNKVTSLILNKNLLSEQIISTLQSSLVQAFKTGRSAGRLNLTDAFKNCRNTLNEIFSQYLQDGETDESGIRTLDWQIIPQEDLLDLGIILIKNHKTNLLDVISLTDLNLNSEIKFKNDNGRTSLAGWYVSNMKSEGICKATNGNIIISKALILMNEILPTLENIKLGKITVVSTLGSGHSISQNIKLFNELHLAPTLRIVSENTVSEGFIKNNITTADGVNYLDQLIKDLTNVLKGSAYSSIQSKSKELLADLANTNSSDSVKIERLTELANLFLADAGLELKSLNEIRDQYAYGKTSGKIAYWLMNALNQLQHLDVLKPVKINSLGKRFLDTRYIPSNNFKIVFRMFDKYSRAINLETFNIGLEITKLCKEYYKNCGYTDLRNITIGDQTSQFASLFEVDDTGKISRDLRFKNPYDMSNNLKLYERDFLKKALFYFAKYRYLNAGLDFNFLSENSPLYQLFIEDNGNWYFACPLLKASTSSQLLSNYYVREKWDRLRDFLRDPYNYSKEYLSEKAIQEELDSRNVGKDAWKLSVHNYFQAGEPELHPDSSSSMSNRNNVIANHDDSRYFETNLETLLLDFAYESNRSQNMRKFMTASKLFTLSMVISGNQNGNIDEYQSELDYINDFLKVNVFGLPLIEANNIILANNINKARHLVSQLFIAGNIAGSIRDTLEGFSQIMVRAIVKNGVGFSASEVTRAYGIVTKDMVSNINTANIISLLCIKYRMSNIDVSNVANGMKTGNRGIFSFQEEMYKTLRTPDFLNRMVFFVSKAIHDGVWDAFSLDKNTKELKYDWKLDKRFNLLAKGDDKSNPEEYNKQKGLFMFYWRKWNEEHPNAQLTSTEELPMPYSENEMYIVHQKADEIWGAYDSSSKALGEHDIIGLTFGMFTTWMNGQIAAYMKPTLLSTFEFEYRQDKDYEGNLLWIDKDGGVTTVNTGVPCLTEVPIMIQGIFLTLKQMWNVLNHGGSLKDEVFDSLLNVDNMKKLVSDVVVTTIYLALIKAILEAIRKKLKEITDPHDLITNSICEVLYKGMYNSWDGFKGPLNLVGFLGEQTNPPFYSESVQVAKDLFRTTFGDMTILSFGSHHIAPLRSIRESIKAYETGKQS